MSSQTIPLFLRVATAPSFGKRAHQIPLRIVGQSVSGECPQNPQLIRERDVGYWHWIGTFEVGQGSADPLAALGEYGNLLCPRSFDPERSQCIHSNSIFWGNDLNGVHSVYPRLP